MVKSNIKLIVRDKEGKIKEERRIPFRSLHRNFNRLLRYLMDGTRQYTIGNGSLTTTYIENAWGFNWINGFYGTAQDVIVGRGSVVGLTHGATSIPTIITFGVGANQLVYFAPKFSFQTNNDSETYWELIKPIVNLTTGQNSVTITCCGIGQSEGVLAVDALDAPITLDYMDALEIIYQVYTVGTTNFRFTNLFLKQLAYFLGNTTSKNYASGVPFPYPLNGYPATNTVGTYTANLAPSYNYPVYSGQAYLKLNAGVGIDTYGIVVGSGIADMNPDSYALTAKISHGTGSGQLSYDHGLDVYGETVIDSNIIQVYAQRKFTNNSSLPIVIREYAWYGYGNGTLRYMYAIGRTPVDLELLPGDSIYIKIFIETEFETADFIED